MRISDDLSIKKLQPTSCIFLVDTSVHMAQPFNKESNLAACAQSILRAYQRYDLCQSECGALSDRQSALVTYGGEINGAVFTSVQDWKLIDSCQGGALLGAGIWAALALLTQQQEKSFQGSSWIFLITSGISDDNAMAALQELRRMCETFPPEDQVMGPPAVTLCVFSPTQDKEFMRLFSPLTRYYPMTAESQRLAINFFQLFEMQDEYSPASWEGLRKIANGMK